MATKTEAKLKQESEVDFKHIKIKGQKDKIYLSDLEVTTKDRITNEKELKYFTKDDQISFTSNAMFMTMLNNEQYKMFVCKIISEITNFTYEYLMKNAHYYKNEMNRDSVLSKGEQGDLIIKIKDKYCLIEMDMNNEINRNVEYSDRVYRINELTGEEYIYPEIFLICFENFSFKEMDKDIMTFYSQTDDGICLVPRTYLLVFLPNLLKRWYDKNMDPELEGFYKTILTMYETSRIKALRYAKGDEIMEKYLEESRKVQKADNGLLRAYDHELSLIKGSLKQGYEEGLEKGLKKGIEEGKSETRIENAKAFFEKGLEKKMIIETLNLEKDEIEALGW